jgi:hypothetical protein
VVEFDAAYDESKKIIVYVNCSVKMVESFQMVYAPLLCLMVNW